MTQNVFARIEKKFVLSEEEYLAMRKALELHMEVDEYGEHTIQNIYFDTDTDELTRTSNEKPVYKEKFRVRCYGTPTVEDKVFLEIKKKYDGIVYKRRITMNYDKAKKYLLNHEVPEDMNPKKLQIFREIDYFLNHYQVAPRTYLAYERIAMYGKEDPDFRITFDRNIRFRNDELSLVNDAKNQYLLKDGYRLMEVKAGAMPLWFVNIISEMELRTTSFSKIGNAYRMNLAEGKYDYVVGTMTSKELDTLRRSEHEYIGKLIYC